MKTFKISVLAMFAVLAIFSCQKEGDEIFDSTRTINPDLGKAFHGSFTLSVSESYNGGDIEKIEIKSHMEGTGGLSLMSPANFELDHLKEIQFAKDENKIIKGTFRVWSDSGAEIYGVYSKALEHGETIEIFATVQGGYGNFQGVRGKLNILLRRVAMHEFNAVVNGSLYGYKPVTVE